MARVYLSLGSNIDRDANLRAGIIELREEFGSVVMSPMYESEAVGFDGDPFYNCVLEINTNKPLLDLADCLKAIEGRNGRRRGEAKFAARTLDIDILTYDDLHGTHDGIVLPRDEVAKHSFVLKPLVDIAAGEVLPGTALSFQQILNELKNPIPLVQVQFDI